MAVDTTRCKLGKMETVAASFAALREQLERRDDAPLTPPRDVREKAEAEALATAAASKRDREQKATAAPAAAQAAAASQQRPSPTTPHSPTEAVSSGEDKPAPKKTRTSPVEEPTTSTTSGLEKLMETKIDAALAGLRNEIKTESERFAKEIESNRKDDWRKFEERTAIAESTQNANFAGVMESMRQSQHAQDTITQNMTQMMALLTGAMAAKGLEPPPMPAAVAPIGPPPGGLTVQGAEQAMAVDTGPPKLETGHDHVSPCSDNSQSQGEDVDAMGQLAAETPLMDVNNQDDKDL